MNSKDTLNVQAQKGIAEWVAQHLNGKVVRIERQARWRPAWFVEVDSGGDLLRLYFRGDREMEEGMGTSTSLRYEYEITRVLEANGIPVPHVYGWCEQPRAAVLTWAEGEPYTGGADRDERLRKLYEDYIDILARIHRIDIEQFVKVGVPRPGGAEAITWGCLPRVEEIYKTADVGPQPLLEFVCAWLRRNVPADRNRVAFITADAPQFLYAGDRITAIHDFEASIIGDPAFDLASMRPRDTVEPSGPLWPFFKRYMAQTGDEIERSVIGWHTVVACARSVLSLLPTFAKAFPHTAYTEYLSMVIANRRDALLAIGEVMGVELKDPPRLRQQPTRAAPALDNLVTLLESWPNEQKSDRYLRLQASSLAHYARRVDELGRAIEDADLQDIAQVLGHMPDSRASADAELEAVVKAAGPDRDREFLEFFYRIAVRDQWLMDGNPGATHYRPLQPLGE